jgi:Flp pilus assembly pilin Flp
MGIVRAPACADTQGMIELKKLRREDGQTMAEYGVVLTVITVACLAAFVLLAAASTNALTRVAGLLS